MSHENDTPDGEQAKEVSWDIKLDFDLPDKNKKAEVKPPPPPKIPPREVLREKFPRILNKIETLWGTFELHKYFKQTQFMDRDGRQGFPPDVVDALGQLNAEHERLLLKSGILKADVWDMQFRDIKPPK